MWERTLQDLIRGLRANKGDESKFIAHAVDEIRREIRGKDMELKAGALLKLTYLDMLGYDMTWASFHVVEVMSSPRFHLKCVGYLAAGQSFGPDTDVLMLATNLLKKDLTSTPSDVAITLNGLSQIINADLARDLSRELIAMLNHSRAHIRKRAVIVLYKVLLNYPDAAENGLPRLRDKLDDPDAGVVAATVNVLCELARQNPADYLTLAPQLFHLLNTSSNNWMLIKLIKIFGSLSPREPRLVKKLQAPITDIISTTPAISLLYECVHTCIVGGMLQGISGHSLARTCVSKLAAFLQDSDQNLKYIALLALTKIVPTHPHLVAEYQDMIMSSIDDQDISIRMRALDLLSAMVDRDNLQSIVQQLLSHLVKSDTTSVPLPSAVQSLTQHTIPTSPSSAKPPTSSLPTTQSPAYRLALSQRILSICSNNMYEFVTDFEWYLSVLVDLAYVANVNVGKQIRDQLVDVVGRVRGARRYAVSLMIRVLGDETLLANAGEEGSCSEILWAAAWLCGEHCGEVSETQKLLDYLLQPSITDLPADIIAVYLHVALKVFGQWAAELADQWDDALLPDVKGVVETIIGRMGEFATSPEMEIQERAANNLELFTFIRADLSTYQPRPDESLAFGEASSSSFATSQEPRFPKSLYLIQPLTSSYELNPVAAQAQASIPLPEGLDLDSWIVPPPKDQMDDQEKIEEETPVGVRKVKKSKKGKGKEQNGTAKTGKRRDKEIGNGDKLTPVGDVETEEERQERERRKAERLARLRDDPFYIVDDRPSKSVDDVDAIPVVKLDDLPPLTSAPSSAGAGSSRLPSLRSMPLPPATSSPVPFTVDRVGEMPRVASPRPSSVLGNGSSPAASLPPSQAVQAASEVPITPAPEPIKVTRVKKKSTAGTGKKKRTAKVDNDASTIVR